MAGLRQAGVKIFSGGAMEMDLTQTRLTAPAAAGIQVGVLRGYVNGVQVGEVPLICAAAVPSDLAEPPTPLQRLLGWFWN